MRIERSPWGIHAEAQYRNHNLIGDLEQLLVRSGLQYNLADKSATFTAGYAFVLSQNEGPENNTISENRLYQEALLRQGFGRVRCVHRFRYEQRFIENQDFRTRFRYALFLNIPLSRSTLSANTWYAALYNEIFINGEQKPNISLFDRNRVYAAIGFMLRDNLGIQAGYMTQVLERRSKSQLQLSVHHNFQL